MHRDRPHQDLQQFSSIRDSLEHDAWINYTPLAQRRHRRRQQIRPHRSLRWQDRVLLTLGIVLMAVLLFRMETAAAQIADDEDSWGLQLHTDSGNYTHLALDTAMHVEVTGLVARVHIAQSFRNDGLEWAEGIYRFPLPDGAAVDRMFIQVGERILEGEIQERQEATRVYQQARDQGQAASLVEQERANQFRTRLANIGPGEEIRVMIGFLANVEYAHGVFSLRLPTTFNRRFESEMQPGLNTAAPQPLLVKAAARHDLQLDLEIELKTDIGFAAIESRYHDIDVHPMDGGYRVTLAAMGERSDRDFEIAWAPDLQAVPQASLMTWDSGDALYAQLMLVPPADDSLLPQPREVVFIIDTSGSMEGAPIHQARAALLRGLDMLDGHDRFNLIQFNSQFHMLFGETVHATPAKLQRAREYVHTLRANGGTRMGPALQAALTLPSRPGLMRQVVFVTDGSVGNERELLEHIAGLLGESRLFTVGIGSAPNSWFMRKAAEIGRGNHTHIGKLDEVEERMTALWADIRLPAISNVCIDWGMDAEYYPEVIPDLYAGSPLWVTARLPSLPAHVTLCGELNGAAWDYELSPRPGIGNETLATLWARRKVEALQDSVSFGADPAMMQAAVTRVALDYGLLTPHTSLVAVDRTPVRLAEETLATGQIPGLLPAGSTTHTAGFPSTATGWKTQLALSLLTLLAASWLYFSPGALRPVATSRGSSHAAS